MCLPEEPSQAPAVLWWVTSGTANWTDEALTKDSRIGVLGTFNIFWAMWLLQVDTGSVNQAGGGNMGDDALIGLETLAMATWMAATFGRKKQKKVTKILTHELHMTARES